MLRDSRGSDFTNYFLAYPSGFKNENLSKEEKQAALASREGVLELCHNHGTGRSNIIAPL